MPCGVTPPPVPVSNPCRWVYIPIPCGDCNLCEGFCQTNATTHSYSQLVANSARGAAGAPSVTKDDMIFKITPKSLFNDLVNYLNEAAATGDSKNSGGYVCPEFVKDFITADDINNLYKHFTQGLQPAGAVTAGKDEVIYANYFSTLFDKINGAQFSPDACDHCNVSCDGSCVSMV